MSKTRQLNDGEGHQEMRSKLAVWLEEDIPDGLTVFALPEKHQ